MAPKADVLILGGGSGGYAAAFRATDLGKSVTLVEKAELGGTCLHRGCIPTKALLHAAELADQARDGDRFGIKTQLAGVDMVGVNAYKDGVVGRLYKGLQGLATAHKVTIVQGTGRLVSPTAVEVDGTVHEAEHVILATGSTPRSLPGLDVDGERIITSEHALTRDTVPDSVVILGGGVIGVEFASIYRSFGADVTIVEALPRLLPAEDEDSSRLLERAFRRRGIGFELGARFAGVRRTDNGIQVSLESGKTLAAELLLVAVGRSPLSDGLGYDEVGVPLDRGYVTVDDLCQTSVPTISAVGDLIDTPKLAHVGFAEGILVAERLAGQSVRPIDYAGVPRITYSDPEVGSVGLTEAQAAHRYGADGYSTYTYDLAGNGKSQILGTRGAVKLVAEKDGPVVGVHLVGARVGELLAEAQLIYNWEALPQEVAQLIHPHPTQSEALGEAHLALAGRPLHVHR